MFDDYLYRRSGQKTDTTFVKNERLKHLVWLAAHGSESAIVRLQRMSNDHKHRAWLYSPSEIKARAKALFDAPSS
jgi:hypothetical protein